MKQYLQLFNYLKKFAILRNKPVKDIDSSQYKKNNINIMKQYLQLFNYLKEFAILRNIPVEDIDSSQYKKIWLDNIPNNDIFYNVIKAEDKKNYWLKINKPKKPKKPEKPTITPPEQLSQWIDENSLYDGNESPVLKQETEEQALFLDDNPELKNTLDEYINNQWLDDLLIWQEKKGKYEQKLEEIEEYQKLFKIYQYFFKFYEELQNNSETHELVMAIGLFNYKNNDTQKYYRHLITQIVNIEYNKGSITVKIGDENPEIESDFIVKIFNNNLINKAKRNFEKIVNDEQSDDIDLLGGKNTKDIVENFADAIGVEVYSHKIEKPQVASQKTVFYAPALILRKKNTSKLSEIYKEIIKNLEHQNQLEKIKLIDYLLGKYPQDNEPPVTNSTAQSEAIYFPHSANQEQAKILDQIKYHDAVVVRGPPGTGKSHTIANLICHLLATGNKVLVTAYTKRSLEVLKDKLPDEYKSLVVNYLGSDQASKDDLNSSVETIKNQSDNFEYIDKTEELDLVNREIAKDTNEYKKIIRQDTQRIDINPAYQGMLVDLLEQLKTNEKDFKWYQDEYSNHKDNDLENQLNRFTEFNETYQFKKLLDFDTIADITKLPTPDQVNKYNQLITQYADLTYLAEHEIQKLEISIQQLGPPEVLKELDNTKIAYPDDNTDNEKLLILRSHAKTLLEYLNKGKRLEGIAFSIIRVFLPTEITEKLYFIKKVQVNGSDCDTVEEFKQVIEDIELEHKFNKLAIIHSTNANGKANKLAYYQDIITLHKLKSQIDKAEKYLANLPVDINFIEQEQYEDIYNDIKQQNQFRDVQQQLNAKIPNTITQILADKLITFQELQPALYFKHAQNYAKQSPKENTKNLEQRIKHNKNLVQDLITDIGANKAWQHTTNKLQDRSLRTELNLWVDAITHKNKKDAKRQMQKCKNVIPCWIMPLQQLVDTITPEQGMYDYIIMDESSQLNIDAMLLLYLAKKIIIVGDDKQVAPVNIGIKKIRIKNLIKKHLQEVPNNHLYDGNRSFFELVNIYFLNQITLKEHFRCMPEIIEFSNQLCYAPHNTPLYPLRSYSEKRLTPLKSFFCADGFVEGSGPGITNKVEAEKIVEKIAKIIQDERYKNKTIGVITLQGNAQKEVIHNLLLEKIDEKEYMERKIICGNAASFQGDERDIIFLSLVTAHNHNRRALTTNPDKRRFNVAASRAKDQMWLFHSVQLSDLTNQNDFRYRLLEHISTYNTPEFQQRQLIPVPNPKPMYNKNDPTRPEPFQSWFEVEVYNDILTKRYQVIPAYKVAGYEIDLVPVCADGTKIAVECDGDYWHSDEQYAKDMERQEILERAGWQFYRIRCSHYINDKNLATQDLWEILGSHSVKEKEAKTNQQNNLDQQKTKPQDKTEQGKQLEIIKSEQPSIFEQNKK